MRISAQKLNAVIEAFVADGKSTFYLASGSKISESEFRKLRQEGGLVDCNTVFNLCIAYHTLPQNILATEADVEEYNRRAGWNNQ